jgi:hypothetical protein
VALTSLTRFASTENCRVPRAFPVRRKRRVLSTEREGAEARASRTGLRGSIGRSRGAGIRGPVAMEPGREPAEVQAYRKLLTASSEHFNILRSAPAFSHDEHWDTQYQKVRKTRATIRMSAPACIATVAEDARGSFLSPSHARVSRSRSRARGISRGFFSLFGASRRAHATRTRVATPRRSPADGLAAARRSAGAALRSRA